MEILKFSPAKAELEKMVDNYSNLFIKDIFDKDGEKKVNEARKDLKRTRVNIQKYGKEMREEANAYIKEVIRQEKELIEIIEPLEDSFEIMVDDIEKERARIRFIEEQTAKIPHRLEQLKQVYLEISEAELIEMSDQDFIEKIQNQKAFLLAQEEERQRKAREKIEADKKALEDEKRKIQEEKDREEEEKKRQIDLEQARIEGENRAKENAEIQARLAIEKQKEQDRLKQEEEKKQKEELEKKKKRQNFLKKCGYDEQTKDLFKSENNGNAIILWKKIGEFKI